MTAHSKSSQGRKAPALYLHLAQVLRRRILSGKYPVGSTLPTEQELRREFDYSRHTVREALRKLTAEGYLQRRQGSGSLVLTTSPDRTYRQSMQSIEELFQYASNTRLGLDRIEIIPADDKVAADLGCAPGDLHVYVESRRFDPESERAICWTLIHISGEYIEVADKLRDSSDAIYRLIEETCDVRVAMVRQEFSALPMPPEVAKALDVEPGRWSVRIVRRYIDPEGHVIMVTVNDHPAETFSYTLELSTAG